MSSPAAIPAPVLFNQSGSDGTIVREWSFSAPVVRANVFVFPFSFWSLTMARSEMEEAESCFKIGTRTFPSSISQSGSESVSRFSTSRKTVLRSYLMETGRLSVDFQDVVQPWNSPQLKISLVLRVKRIELEAVTIQALGRMSREAIENAA